MTTPELTRLPWDSDFLGFPVGLAIVPYPGAAAVAAVAAQVHCLDMRLTYLLLDPDDAAAAAAARHAGAYLADRKVTLQCPIPAHNASVEPVAAAVVRIREFQPELEQLALQSGEYSRFRTDKRFAPGVFEQLYNHWLRASFSGEMAEAVFAFHNARSFPTGLLTLQPQGPVARIGLLAVRAETRGQGQGRALVEAAQRTAQEWGCGSLRVTTQLDNEPACRFYAQCGFTIEQVAHLYHLWR